MLVEVVAASYQALFLTLVNAFYVCLYLYMARHTPSDSAFF